MHNGIHIALFLRKSHKRTKYVLFWMSQNLVVGNLACSGVWAFGSLPNDREDAMKFGARIVQFSTEKKNSKKKYCAKCTRILQFFKISNEFCLGNLNAVVCNNTVNFYTASLTVFIVLHIEQLT